MVKKLCMVKEGFSAIKVRETGKERETSFLRHAPAKLGS
jgi:hypothetical protein